MEEGEMALDTCIGLAYDPALEWPGESSASRDDTLTGHSTSHEPSKSLPWLPLRLLVQRTSILPKNRKLAVLDAYGEAQFGRDVAPAGSETPRVRLKEMEVSKLHATVYWDKQRREWSIVDMGSKHGTFLKSSQDPSQVDKEGVRLSPPRVASVPRRLRHLDLVTIGSTMFLVHIHEDHKPCFECSSSGTEDIPLFNAPKDSKQISLKRSRDLAIVESESERQEPRDPKKALTMLKRSLLMRHNDSTNSSKSARSAAAGYVDRSARRRSVHGSGVDAPGVPSSRSGSPGVTPPFYGVSREGLPSLPVSIAEKSHSPTPLPETNIGHRLLMKQGWQPGTSLGISSEGDSPGLVEPLEVISTSNRAGLGMPAQAVSQSETTTNWKEHARQRRWDALRPVQ
ncbi:hypothetical protein SERLA73DRAFT_181269 [Serpula lacrymans var. lacrymans S7.3]|uniref:G-patch domain-containing protein n=2 Tax=Serpula lacrymans var. lacrymans TaxID=341189 RepID=F8PXS0_SERL3|nr:uncharacterized protein SERLADRAFT_467348 [Serpula lacrymans var. lacrymans S7.9]EGN98683.1 hypothetical protein SERLA73DRAFT_181269 [Serpula lacrymans var. lacrymans S7.3]EGO24287.1 hypothetical protein SERLADRAFT_467348 [Serpula lacrymans var. lacrymans S7.9]